jgi:hypothetical protein
MIVAPLVVALARTTAEPTPRSAASTQCDGVCEGRTPGSGDGQLAEITARGGSASYGGATQRERWIDLAVCRYLVQPMEIDMIKYAVCVALLIGVSAPAFAAEYYIVRGSDKKCKVVETRPTDKTMIVVGDKAYITREEATKQLTVVCKD